jgi:hypothetical protein
MTMNDPTDSRGAVERLNASDPWPAPIDGFVPAVWEYRDARGVTCRGVKVGSTDFGGHDVSEHFRREMGQLDIVRGAGLQSVVCVEPARIAA